MTLPVAAGRGVAAAITGVRVAATIRTADTGDKLVTKRAERRLERREAISAPFSTIGTGDGVAASEGNVQDVVGIVCLVSVHGITVAGSAERVRDLTDQRRAIITVGVSPNTVELEDMG